MTKAKTKAPAELPKKGGSYVIAKDGGTPVRKEHTKPAKVRPAKEVAPAPEKKEG